MFANVAEASKSAPRAGDAIWIRRFRSRFDSVAVLHSHLTDVERHWHWQQIADGKIQVIVGARSAIFAPAPRLGLIVIDEEHETSFKQDTAPRYHAREVARKRAELLRIPLIVRRPGGPSAVVRDGRARQWDVESAGRVAAAAAGWRRLAEFARCRWP